MKTTYFFIFAIIIFLRPPLIFAAVLGRKLDLSSPLPHLITSPGATASKKPQLALVSVINYAGGPNFEMGPICTEGTKMALDALRNASVLDRYELTVELFNDQCLRQEGVRAVANVLNGMDDYANVYNRAPVILGPICSPQTYTGMFMKPNNVVGYGGASIIPEMFTNHRLYSSFYSLTGGTEMHYDAIPAFCAANGWQKVYLLSETFTYWPSYERVMNNNFAKYNITLAGTSKILVMSGMPTQPEYIRDAVVDLKAMDPRIIVVNTNYGSLLACWLYRYNLFGPNYVFLYIGFGYFLPNTRNHYPDCTEEMLFQVLKSFILFAPGTPINLDENSVDSLGTSRRFLEGTLMAKIDEPELYPTWFFWRTFCYEQVAVAALALNSVDQTLKEKDDSLMNWTLYSPNFQKNGAHIMSLIKEATESLQYRGLNSNVNKSLNALDGMTGFYQMQMVSEAELKETTHYARMLKLVPVAVYDSSDQNATLKQLPGGKLAWLTYNGHAPLDSLQIIAVKEGILSDTTSKALAAISIILILANVTLLIAIVRKIKTDLIAKSMPFFNIMMLIGNCFMLTFIVVMPTQGSLTSHLNCMAGSILLIFGFSLLTSTIVAKLHAANKAFRAISRETSRLLTKRLSVIGGVGGGKISVVSASSSCASGSQHSSTGSTTKRSSSTSTSAIIISTTMTASEKKCVQELGEKMLRKSTLTGLFTVVCWTLLQTIVGIIWFGIRPIIVTRFDQALTLSGFDLSLAYQFYTYTCSITADSVDFGFIGALIIGYVLVFLRSITLAFSLRKGTFEAINDLHLVRMVSYQIGMMAFAGGAVIYGFFVQNPATMQTAVCVVVIAIVATNMILVFSAKLVHLCNV